MHSDTPLLIMADIPETYCLHDLILTGQASKIIKLIQPVHQDHDRLHAVIGGMEFILTQHSAEVMHRDFLTEDMQSIFYDRSETALSSIGISLSDHIKPAQQNATINRAMLQLAKYVGQSVEAASVIWRPAALQIGFNYFVGATDHYVVGGPFPVLAQIAISETSEGNFQTSGLSYFADQEIKIGAPSGYAPNEVVKRLVRVAHEIATNGKINEIMVIEGFVEGEKLSIMPDTNCKIVDVAIIPYEPRQLQ
ncbi:MAG: hypothetical protein V7676_04980 [Parasphingorhabdus sp.]|uniref:hypothetical protein n=1 Tax=Parasphingorhabdus sp. TaxID=2709688 RepID=UPI0030019EE8